MKQVYVNPKFRGLAEALWRPRTRAAVLSYSRGAGFATCAQRWAYRDIKGIVPALDAKPLSFGTLFHEAMATLYRGLSQGGGGGPAEALRVIADWNWEMFEKMGSGGASYSQETVNGMTDLAKSMVQRVIDRWFASDAFEYELVATELPFRLPLPPPASRRVCGDKRGLTRWDYSGSIDLVLRRVRDGGLVLLDWKTWSGTDPGRYVLDLQVDRQRSAYLWAIRQGLAAVPLLGTSAEEFLYSVVRKKAPSVPKTVQCPKCKGAGCAVCAQTGVGGISKAACDTTPEAYEAALAKYPHLARPDYSDGLKDAVRGKTWAFREATYSDAADQERWLDEAWTTTRVIAEAVSSGRFLRNRKQCLPLAGSRCPYLSLCDGCEPDSFTFKTVPPSGLYGLPEVSSEAETEAEGADEDKYNLPF